MVDKISRKGQAAIEFLSTYGWAILVIMIAIGALSYFGFTNPARVLPDKCLFGNGIICQDSRIATDAVNVTLINGLGRTIYNLDVDTDGWTANGGSGCSINLPSATGDDLIRINCKPPFSGVTLTKDQKIKLRFKVTYQKTPTGYTQESLGEVYGTVQ